MLEECYQSSEALWNTIKCALCKVFSFAHFAVRRYIILPEIKFFSIQCMLRIYSGGNNMSTDGNMIAYFIGDPK